MSFTISLRHFLHDLPTLQNYTSLAQSRQRLNDMNVNGSRSALNEAEEQESVTPR